MTSDLRHLFGHPPNSEILTSYISSLAPHAPPQPEVKSYPHAVYFNYFSLGLSLLFKPVNGYKPRIGLKRNELKDDSLDLDGIDIYNLIQSKPDAKTTEKKSPYQSYPVETFSLPLVVIPDKSRPATMEITRNTTGKQFVETMGEPDRKGGGAGPSTGSIGIWCEWSKDGVMVEFGGEESKGPKAWETGKDALWKVLTIFPPSQA